MYVIRERDHGPWPLARAPAYFIIESEEALGVCGLPRRAARSSSQKIAISYSHEPNRYLIGVGGGECYLEVSENASCIELFKGKSSADWGVWNFHTRV